ncbi:ATP-dependent helicase [Methanosarcinales archaeon]|nr:MAG: ATP-dependent helicase [Methanosarcinales archaeon]
MQVLHTIWNGDELCLWAEASALPLTAPPRRGRPPKNPKPRTHPFALPADILSEISESTFGQTPSGIGTMPLLLPSTQRGPLPSPWLVREEECDHVKAAALAGWNVETLIFDPEVAFDLLLDLPASPPHGIAFGSSLRFWTEAALFSLALITEEQFIPTIRENIAVWTAVIAGDNVERMRTLADVMPAYCRALIIQKEGGSGAQDMRPQHIIRSFVDRTVDAFVRRSLASVSLIPPRRGRRPKITPMPERLLSALSTGNLVLDAPIEAVEAFSGKLEGWLTGIQPAMPSAPFRTCFRLDAPPDPDEWEYDEMNGGDGNYYDENSGEGESGGEDESGGEGGGGGDETRERDPGRDWNRWSLGFFLQAKDDPSLLIPADKVWKTRSETLTFLKRKFKNPQEQLLADLGRASHTYPPIEKSLQDARPVGFDMSAGQAYSFLREFAPILEQNGFGVLLPPWWDKPGARLGVKLKIKTPSPVQEGGIGSGHFSVKSIMSYDWTVAIGDNTLSMDEFKHLASLKIPLVQVRGKWVELRPEDVETAINFFEKKHKEREITLGEAMRLGLGADDARDEIGLPVVGVETEGWLKEMLSKFSGDEGGNKGEVGDGAKITLVDQPGAFNGLLRPYQAKGVSWLAYLCGFGFGACLADDMGLGKTVELIAFLLHVREEGVSEEGKTPDPTLLICPMSVVGNWRKEVERFAPSLGVMIHHGADRLAGRAFAEEAEKHDLVISTYALAHRDEEALSQVHWRHIVLDEAQNIKNPAAKQTQAIKRIKADHTIALTGTPVENRLSDLWSIMDFLNRGYLGSAQGFRKSFAIPIEKYRDDARAEVLRRIIQPFVLRRLKTDPTIIQDLPEKVEAKVYHNLTPEQASLYEAVVAEMLDKLEYADGIERKGIVLATLTKLKQICNHPALFLQDGSLLKARSGKLTRLSEMLEEVLSESDKALIFTQFAGMGAMLRHHLQERFDCEVLFLHGGTSRKQRDEMVQRFQQDEHGPRLFVLSLKAGGFGLNLTAANHVFHFDRWWNPAVENQATDRVFRIGQTKNVFAHKFVCIGTLEERIDRMLEEKKALADAIVGSGEAWITELSTDELKDIFTLSRDAALSGGD